MTFSRLFPEQIAKINAFHPLVIQNFKSREAFSIVGFVLLALIPVLWLKKENK